MYRLVPLMSHCRAIQFNPLPLPTLPDDCRKRPFMKDHAVKRQLFLAVFNGSRILLGVATGLRACGVENRPTSAAGRDACRYWKQEPRKLTGKVLNRTVNALT